ncbi:hypothetical protein cypCar_00035526, partial [Cyprinus carpio]
MDTKPLLQDRPPAYNTVPAAYDYGSVPRRLPAPARAYQAKKATPKTNTHRLHQRPETTHLTYCTSFPAATSGYPAAPAPPAAIATQPAYTSTYTIVQPSVVVVGGCPAC